MDGLLFLEKCLYLVQQREQIRADKYLHLERVYIISVTKTLQNNKGFFSSEFPNAPMYEINYNGDKDEFYVDTYEKTNNECIKGED